MRCLVLILPLVLSCVGPEPGVDAGADCADASACQPGVTGAACTGDPDCAEPQYCELQAPEGYCTRDCTPCPESCRDEPSTCPVGCVGVDEALCPNGGRCARVALGASLEAHRCLARCEEDVDCRTGYLCKFAPGSTIGLCLP